jgi:hypothetical protein
VAERQTQQQTRLFEDRVGAVHHLMLILLPRHVRKNEKMKKKKNTQTNKYRYKTKQKTLDEQISSKNKLI